MSIARIRYCRYCGEELGILWRSGWAPHGICSFRECTREAREEAEAKRDELHRNLTQNHSFIRNRAQLVRDLRAYADALEQVILPAVKP